MSSQQKGTTFTKRSLGANQTISRGLRQVKDSNLIKTIIAIGNTGGNIGKSEWAPKNEP